MVLKPLKHTESPVHVTEGNFVMKIHWGKKAAQAVELCLKTLFILILS